MPRVCPRDESFRPSSRHANSHIAGRGQGGQSRAPLSQRRARPGGAAPEDCESGARGAAGYRPGRVATVRRPPRSTAPSVTEQPRRPSRPGCSSRRQTAVSAPGSSRADAAAAERQESRGLTRQRLPLCPDDAALRRRPRAGSAPPLARFTPAASRRAAVSAPSTRLPVLVQGSDASNATKLLARSPGSRLPASAVTTAPPRGCRTNHTGCTNLTMVDFADLVREAQARRAGPPRRK